MRSSQLVSDHRRLRQCHKCSAPSLCFSSVCASRLFRLVLQQNERFSEIEEKYKSLNGKTSSLFAMEEDVLKVSKKLAASEDDLREALSTVSMATRLEQEISTLHAAVAAMQDDENSASRDLQTVNAHFLNVTETWQQRLAAVSSDLTALKAESREAHAGATERVNEAERRGRSLAERLEELEDSTGRNARAMERTEGDDTRRAEEHLDWNTEQVHKLEERIRGLTASSAELGSQLEEHVPRARECEEHLPQVEEAVRSILRLAADLSAAERRLEEVTLQRPADAGGPRGSAGGSAASAGGFGAGREPAEGLGLRVGRETSSAAEQPGVAERRRGTDRRAHLGHRHRLCQQGVPGCFN
uniref:IKBKB interacting protein n=1 Tax=Gasterosteus aculeatus aculeatus TaxID=481459 RepID=G3Q8L5_GASAC